MEREVKEQLKEMGKYDLFTKSRYLRVKEVMSYATSQDSQLKKYLSISPDFKVNFICDHIVKYVNEGKI